MSESLEERLSNRRKPGDPDYDAFYDATDDDLAGMVPPPSFLDRRASADPTVDHRSHSTQWAGRCPECPSGAS